MTYLLIGLGILSLCGWAIAIRSSLKNKPKEKKKSAFLNFFKNNYDFMALGVLLGMLIYWPFLHFMSFFMVVSMVGILVAIVLGFILLIFIIPHCILRVYLRITEGKDFNRKCWPF